MILDLTLILGGVRSGKSRAALRCAEDSATCEHALFVATAEARDDEMQRRIAAHRLERGPRWETLEAPLDLPESLDARLAAPAGSPSVVVIDCLTLWVSNLLLSLDDPSDGEHMAAHQAEKLLSVIEHYGDGRRWIIVSNEVGLGVVPPTALGRHYRDALGRANQIVANRATRVALMVAGLSLDIKATQRG